MAEVKSAWNDAGERLGGLGRRLKGHYDVQRGEESEQVGAELKEAVKKLTEAVQDAFEAVGAAAKDQAVKDDVRQVGQSLTVALGATFTEISETCARPSSARPPSRVPRRGTAGSPELSPGRSLESRLGSRTSPAWNPGAHPDRPATLN
jgi:hypothetical protein